MTDNFSERSLSVIVENKPTLCSPLTLSAFKNGISVPLFKTLHPNNGLRSYTQSDETVRLAMNYDIPFDKTIQYVVTLLQAHISLCRHREGEKVFIFDTVVHYMAVRVLFIGVLDLVINYHSMRVTSKPVSCSSGVVTLYSMRFHFNHESFLGNLVEGILKVYVYKVHGFCTVDFSKIVKEVEDNILQDNILEDNILEDNILEDNILEDSILEDNNLEDNILEDNILEDNILEDSILEDNNLEDNIWEDNILEDNILEDNLLEDNILKVNMCVLFLFAFVLPE
ncbi:hypothetical protein FHG87_018470 [Trinorchestia longiramus]|nr:hypothetical protein FHG87_018470 [Trinorchestia longiramus]